MNIKTLLINGATAAILATGVITVGAQDATEEPAPQEQAEAFGRFGERGERGSRDGDFGRGGFRGALGGGEVRDLVEQYTGLEGRDLREAMGGGDTMASLIEANGGSVDDFVTEAATLAEARIDVAVENGNLDEARAEEAKANLTEMVTAMVNGEQPIRDSMRGRDGRGGRGGRGIMGDIGAELLEEYTGLNAQALREAMSDGATVAELIEANGGDVEAFLDEATTLVEVRIDERTEKMKENLRENLEAMINGERPRRGMAPDA